MHGLARDLKYAWRGLGRAPAFAAIAIIHARAGHRRQHRHLQHHSCCACCGPCPIRIPASWFASTKPKTRPATIRSPGLDFLDWKAQNHSFADMAVFSYGQDMNLSGTGQPDHVIGTLPKPTSFRYSESVLCSAAPSPPEKMNPATIASSSSATVFGKASSMPTQRSLAGKSN